MIKRLTILILLTATHAHAQEFLATDLFRSSGTERSDSSVVLKGTRSFLRLGGIGFEPWKVEVLARDATIGRTDNLHIPMISISNESGSRPPVDSSVATSSPDWTWYDMGTHTPSQTARLWVWMTYDYNGDYDANVAIHKIRLSKPAGPGYTRRITITWDHNPEGDLAGYIVYSGNQTRHYTTTDTTQSRRWSKRFGPGTWYFAITAYDTSGNESGYSNEVSSFIQVKDETAPAIPTRVGISVGGE